MIMSVGAIRFSELSSVVGKTGSVSNGPFKREIIDETR